MLTFEGTQLQGATAILEKLQGLPFQTVKHVTETTDVQPTGQGGSSLLVQVTGQLMVSCPPSFYASEALTNKLSDAARLRRSTTRQRH